MGRKSGYFFDGSHDLRPSRSFHTQSIEVHASAKLVPAAPRLEIKVGLSAHLIAAGCGPERIFLMSSHTPVSERQLLNWMNPKIQRYEGCKDVVIKGVNRLREPDQHGNNWAASFARATDVPRQLLYPALDQVIREAKTRFNLSEN
jgi:hypothetical protein